MFNDIKSVKEVFYSMLERDGYSAWWMSDESWGSMREEMLLLGCASDEIEDFFSELAWEL